MLTIPLEEVELASANRDQSVLYSRRFPQHSVGRCARPAGSIDNSIKTIAVFGITGVGTVGNEVSDIAFVAKAIAAAPVWSPSINGGSRVCRIRIQISTSAGRNCS